MFKSRSKHGKSNADLKLSSSRGSNQRSKLEAETAAQALDPEQLTDGSLGHGYCCKLVKQHPKLWQIHCELCSGIFRDPCRTTCCGKGYCQGCLEEVAQKKKPCPGCTTKNFDFFNNEALAKELKKIDVYCVNQEHGCRWSGTLKKLKKHINLYNTDDSKTCKFLTVACHLCSKTVRLNILERHLADSCSHRRYQCQYCADFKSTFEDVMTNHRPLCKYSPATCPNCGESVMKVDLENHISNDCPKKQLICEFGAFGCTARMYRRDMPQHLEDRSAQREG